MNRGPQSEIAETPIDRENGAVRFVANVGRALVPKLLVVDDEPALVDRIRGVFEKQGIDVVGADSAAEAIEAVNRQQPDMAV